MHPDDKELTEAMRRVVERLATARWVERSLVSQPHLDVHFSELGRERLRQLDAILTEMGWPQSQAETLALSGLCSRAGGEPPTSPAFQRE